MGYHHAVLCERVAKIPPCLQAPWDTSWPFQHVCVGEPKDKNSYKYLFCDSTVSIKQQNGERILVINDLKL